MDIKFFDDPFEGPKPREEVKIKQLGLYMHEDSRRVAVGFDLTPFLERPSIQVTFTNESGEEAGSLHVIETLQTNFSLTVHLRDKEPTEMYEVTAVVYYATPETERVDVHTLTRTLNRTTPGEQ
ncbi:hypothetical protein [Candidatus Leptofilum sp.]|uniref:hypothetical protein n=1 Tax=Candidatus Leptofilum sp. TaxID=3241576 RepID=UPI003B5BD10A